MAGRFGGKPDSATASSVRVDRTTIYCGYHAQVGGDVAKAANARTQETLEARSAAGWQAPIALPGRSRWRHVTSADRDTIESPPHRAEPQSTRPTLILFFSPTGGGSRRAEGFLAQVLQRRRNHDTFELKRIDADRRSDLVERFGVQEIPTLLVVADKRICRRLSKPRGCREIADLLSPWLR
jgi:hypothetical protein